MPITTTTLASPVLVNDNGIFLTSTTDVQAFKLLRIDDEFFQVQQGYGNYINRVSALPPNLVPVLRGREGTVTTTHPAGAAVSIGFGVDFQIQPGAGVSEAVSLPGVMPRATNSYSANGAIAVPTQTGLTVAQLNGTTPLAMTLAAPPIDANGAMLLILGNGLAAHTVAIAAGVTGPAHTVTLSGTAQTGLLLVAAGGAWAPLSGATLGTIA